MQPPSSTESSPANFLSSSIAESNALLRKLEGLDSEEKMKMNEIERLQAIEDAVEYQHNRREQYPETTIYINIITQSTIIMQL